MAITSEENEIKVVLQANTEPNTITITSLDDGGERDIEIRVPDTATELEIADGGGHKKILFRLPLA